MKIAQYGTTIVVMHAITAPSRRRRTMNVHNRMTRAEDFEFSARVPKSDSPIRNEYSTTRIGLNDATVASCRIKAARLAAPPVQRVVRPS